MKKIFRIITIIICLASVLLLSGCTPSYDITIDLDDDFNGEMVDILLPFSEKDVDYTDDPKYDAAKNLGIDIKEHTDWKEMLRKTELYNYNADGYRSVLMHYNDCIINSYRTYTNFSFSGTDSDFENLCREYKTFRIAVIGKDGEVLRVTEEMPLSSHKNYYLGNSMEYDSSSNKLKARYINRDFHDDIFLLALASLTASASIFIIMLVMIIVEAALHRTLRYMNFRLFGIISAVISIPGAAYIVCKVIDSFNSTLTTDDALGYLFKYIILLIIAVLPLISAVCCAIASTKYQKKPAPDKPEDQPK